MSDSWYALYVRSRFEKIAQTQLENKGYEVFLPMHAALGKLSERSKSRLRPLFPNYLFCRFDYRRRLSVLMTPGIQFVVGAGKTPSAVDEEEITAVRRAIESRAPLRPCPYVEIGTRLWIVDGPLKGLTGVFERNGGRDRLILSITALGRSVAVQLDRRWVTRPLMDLTHQPIYQLTH